MRRGMVFSCPHGVVSSRPVLAVGVCCLLFAPPLLARSHLMVISSGYAVGCLKNGGGRLLVSFVGMWPSFRLSRLLVLIPQSFAYLVRFSYVSAFRLGNRFRPAHRVEQDGEQDGEGFCPRCELMLRWRWRWRWRWCATNVGAISFRSILALLRSIQSNCSSPFPFLFLALPPLACSRRSACLNCSPAPGRGRRGRLGRFAAAGVRVACLRSHFLVPLSRSSLVRYRCRARSPCDGSYDDHVFDRHRLRLSPAGVAWCFLLRIVCGEQMGTARLSNIASSLVPPPLCSCLG